MPPFTVSLLGERSPTKIGDRKKLAPLSTSLLLEDLAKIFPIYRKMQLFHIDRGTPWFNHGHVANLSSFLVFFFLGGGRGRPFKVPPLVSFPMARGRSRSSRLCSAQDRLAGAETRGPTDGQCPAAKFWGHCFEFLGGYQSQKMGLFPLTYHLGGDFGHGKIMRPEVPNKAIDILTVDPCNRDSSSFFSGAPQSHSRKSGGGL